MIIRITMQIKQGKMAYSCNDCGCECQKYKRKGVPMHNEWPTKEAEGFNLYSNIGKPQKTQGNCDVDKVTNVSPQDHLANPILVVLLLSDKIVDIYKEYLGYREQCEIIYEVGNQNFFVHTVLLDNLPE